MGTIESADWGYFGTTQEVVVKLKNDDIIISIEQVDEAILLQDFHVKPNETYALAFGIEVKGVQQSIVDLSDYAVEIPQFGTKYSLNISARTGVILWKFVKKINYKL